MEFILIILSSLLFTIPLYLPSLFFLSWFAFIPLIYLTIDYDYSHSFIAVLLISILNALFSLYWLYRPLSAQLNMPSSFIIFIIFLFILLSSLPLAIWILLNKFLQPKYSFSPIIAAFTFSAVEILRYYFFNINPFNYLAYTQAGFSFLSQYAAYGGMFLVSFLTVLIAAYIVKIFLKPSLKRSVPLILIFIIIFILPVFLNLNLTNNYDYKEIDILVNKFSSETNQFEKIEQDINILTELLKNTNSDLVLTPVNSISFDILRNNFYRDKFFANLEQQLQLSYFQLGGKAVENNNFDSDLKNSQLLFDHNLEILNRYNKRANILAAFNFEYKEELFNLINNYIHFEYDKMLFEGEVTEADNLKFLNLIDDEIFLSLTEENYGSNNYNLIVHSASEAEINSIVYNNLSQAAAVFRAAESRTSVISVVRGGKSAYITPRGKIEYKANLENEIKTINAVLIDQNSYYQKNPYHIVYSILAINLFFFLVKLIIIIKAKISSRN